MWRSLQNTSAFVGSYQRKPTLKTETFHPRQPSRCRFAVAFFLDSFSRSGQNFYTSKFAPVLNLTVEQSNTPHWHCCAIHFISSPQLDCSDETNLYKLSYSYTFSLYVTPTFSEISGGETFHITSVAMKSFAPKAGNSHDNATFLIVTNIWVLSYSSARRNLCKAAESKPAEVSHFARAVQVSP